MAPKGQMGDCPAIGDFRGTPASMNVAMQAGVSPELEGTRLGRLGDWAVFWARDGCFLPCNPDPCPVKALQSLNVSVTSLTLPAFSPLSGLFFFVCLFFNLFVFLPFLGLHPRHMEVPRLGV